MGSGFFGSSYFIFFIVLLLVVVAISYAWTQSRSQSILQKWADVNGYQIVEKERRTFLKGPFFWSSSKSQIIFRVVVRDEQGYTRSGWVRCGSWWWGLFTDDVDVRWDE